MGARWQELAEQWQEQEQRQMKYSEDDAAGSDNEAHQAIPEPFPFTEAEMLRLQELQHQKLQLQKLHRKMRRRKYEGGG